MKKPILVTLLLLVCFVFCKAQQTPPGWLWLDGSGGSNYQYGAGIGTDDSGFHYISGRFGGTITFQGVSGPVNLVDGSGDVTPFVGKFDENGNCLWLTQKTFGWDYPRGFCTDKAKNNNEYVTGNNNSGDGMFVYKFDNLGNLVWPTYLGTSSFYGYGGSPNSDGVAADTAGNVYVTGETGDGSYTFGDSTLTNGSAGTTWPQNQEMFLTKLDKNGNFLWAVGAEDANGAASYDVGRDVVLDETGQYVFVCGGYQNTPVFHSKFSTGDITAPTAAGGTSSFFVSKYDTAGNLLFVSTATNAGIPWSNGFNSGVGAVNALTVDSCGDVYVVGYYFGTAQFGPQLSLTASNTGGQPDGFVGSLNSMGQWQWVDDIGSSISNAGDYAQNIALDKNNDVYVGGTINGTANFGNGVSAAASSTQGSLFLAKYANSNGAVQWAQTSSGSSQSGTSGLAIDTQKFVYICGSFNGTLTLGGKTVNASTNEGNIFIAKLDTVPTLYIVPIIDTSYCAGETITIPYTVSGAFNQGNEFTAQLSDSTGSFLNAQNIGSNTSTGGGTITVTIPANTPSGSNYLIRVVSSNPAASSYVNGCGAYYQQNVYVNNFYVKIGTGSSTFNLSLSPANPTICSGSSITLKALGGTSDNWINNNSSADSITVSPTTDSTFMVDVTGGCGGGITVDTFIRVTVNPDTSTLNPQYPSLCDGGSIVLTLSASGTYNWSPSTGLSAVTGDTVTANPTATVTYTVTGTNSLGCAIKDSDVITVNTPITQPTFHQRGDTLISSYSQGNTWTLHDSTVTNYTDSSIVITKSGYYQVTETNSVNGCSATSDSVYVTGINQLAIPANALSVYPNPTNGAITLNIKVSSDELKGLSLQITDVLGRTLYTRSSVSYTNEIDLSQFSSGVYFISIVNNNGRTVLPIVKQN